MVTMPRLELRAIEIFKFARCESVAWFVREFLRAERRELAPMGDCMEGDLAGLGLVADTVGLLRLRTFLESDLRTWKASGEWLDGIRLP